MRSAPRAGAEEDTVNTMSRRASSSVALLVGALLATAAAAPEARAQEVEVDGRTDPGLHGAHFDRFDPFRVGGFSFLPGYGSVRGQVHLVEGDDARVDVEVSRVGSRCCLFGSPLRGYGFGPLYRSGSPESGGWWEGLGLFEERMQEDGEPDG